MSKSENAKLSVVGLVYAPKGTTTQVAYVQVMAGDKKAGSFIRADYVRHMLDNPEATRAAIKYAENSLVVVAPAPVAAPVAQVAPVAAPANDQAAMMAALMQQIAAMQAALGLAPAAAQVIAPVAVAKPSPLSDRASKVRAAANR